MAEKQKPKKTLPKSTVSVARAFPKERAAFRALLLSNPNYFGNLVKSPLKPILPITGNTFYEELACVGYQPQQERLEAVVYVYQTSGYGTDVCGAGTSEYVRFYLSFDNGLNWQDQGLTSFQTYNIPEGTEGEKRLEYAVTLPIHPHRLFCLANPLIRVRAILSWNNPPPPNDPDFPPVWGNVREATIQVDKLRRIFPPDLFELAQFKLPPAFADVLDNTVPLQLKSKALNAGELAVLYRGKDVPVHRFAFKELTSFISGQTTLNPLVFSPLLPDIKINPEIFELLFPKTDGDTSFEELMCIGLDPNTPNTLVGIIKVKKESGFSGGFCTDGSREYVTFWADFDGNGSFETCLGTAGVQVYDFDNIKKDGIFYAVRLPVNLDEHRRPCLEGAKVVRIRAILSWNQPAPCANPNHVPTWGNREETLIHIAQHEQAPAGKIAILGGIPVGQIGSIDGLTTPDAKFTENNLPPDGSGRPCPFAGRVSVRGTPIPGFSYIVEVSQDGAVWTPVLTDLEVTDQNGDPHTHKANPVTKRFDYLPVAQNANILLAQWDSGGDALWQVRLTVYDAGGVQQGSADLHVIQLDNTGPEAEISITSGTGNCGKFPIGATITGDFVARDLYFGGYSLSVEPAINPAGVGEPSPGSGNVQTGTVPGDGDWSLNTAGMTHCGYVVRVVVSDRAIINSQAGGHSASDSVGFCLEKPEDL